MRSDIKYAVIFSLSHLSHADNVSLSSAVIGQLTRSHDTQNTNLSISDVQKTLLRLDCIASLSRKPMAIVFMGIVGNTSCVL